MSKRGSAGARKHGAARERRSAGAREGHSIGMSFRAKRGICFSMVALVACAPRTTTPTTPPAPAVAPATQPATNTLPKEIRWFRNSAEYRALALQTYRVATSRLPDLSRSMAPESWGVILDADETVLDNSEYQRRRAALDSGFTEATWAAWVNERKATPVPGAVDFARIVHTMHGKVVVVTNRADSLCAATRDNLNAVGFQLDLVLCQPPGESDKNPRFERVQSGTASPNFPKLTVVAWFGDNIQDFPRLTQTSRNTANAFADFGRRYFVLPNPMYGSWERNAEP